jgi:hypothetical protein
VAVVDVLLTNAGEMSDDQILAKLATCTISELQLRQQELIQRRQQVRLIFGHINSTFLSDSPGKREYETLVRLTDLARVAISRKSFDARPSIPSSKAQGQKRGPQRDYATAARVAKIIAQVAPDGNWRAKLDDICDKLDESEVPCPKTWKKKGYLTWYDCCAGERDLVIKAIVHHVKNHLKRVKEQEATFS